MSKRTLPLFSFEEYISELKYQLESSDDDYEFYYRGCCSHDWNFNLTSGIYRDSHIKNEDINFREMILRSPIDFVDDKTTLEKLVKMQHYGLPTRLLDITSNPLVALYFASIQYKDLKTNGKIYVFKIPKGEIKYYDSDAVALVSNLAKLRIDKTNFKSTFGYLMHEIREEKPYYLSKFKTENNADIKKVFLVKVKLNNNRIVRQSGAFLIFGMKNLTSKELSAILPSTQIEKEIIIDKSGKANILKSLKSLAINEYTLFPELEHQANFLVK
jgi:hypothetical protein